ncbi:Alpha/Beta hydrolase fold [Phytophthora cactorum]|nr:Alpha/Beta hydrolase fold [Phytophthora cactorum]
MAEDMLALLDHIGWEQAHVVGYSMGGMISLELAHMAPGRVKSLSLLCTTRGRYLPVCNGVMPMTRTLDHSDANSRLIISCIALSTQISLAKHGE